MEPVALIGSIGAILALVVNALSLAWVIWQGSGMIHTLKAREEVSAEVQAQHGEALTQLLQDVARQGEAILAGVRTMQAIEVRLLHLEHPGARL